MIQLLDATLVGETCSPTPPPALDATVLVLGVGNLLMGDEGAGVHVLRLLETEPSIPGVRLLDGGTGGASLLTEFEGVRSIVLIDATRDGSPSGTVVYRFRKHLAVTEIPTGLSAHDFGLKDLFAAATLIGLMPELHLYTIAVNRLAPMCTELSAEVAGALPEVVHSVRGLAARLAQA
jgi:hydrogenase maturation protease